MMTPEQHTGLAMAVTEYDQRQSGKPGYNIYALPQYLGAVQRADDEMSEGASLRDALLTCFTGRLLAACLKAVGEPRATEDEIRARDRASFQSFYGGRY
jgi:hypothetical protein